MSIGRIFRLREGVQLSIRADFQNIFNRTQVNMPSLWTGALTNATAPQLRDASGKPFYGFGQIDTTSVSGNPRSGMIVARIQF